MFFSCVIKVTRVLGKARRCRWSQRWTWEAPLLPPPRGLTDPLLWQQPLLSWWQSLPPPHSKAPDAQHHDTAASADTFLPFSHLAFIFRSPIRSPVSPGQQPAALHPAAQGWVCRADAHSHFQLTATVNGTWHRVGLCVLSTSVWFSYYSCAL